MIISISCVVHTAWDGCHSIIAFLEAFFLLLLDLIYCGTDKIFSLGKKRMIRILC